MKQFRGMKMLGKLDRITRQIADLEARLEREGDTPELREQMNALRREVESLRGKLK